jgi:hypothetical protein
MKLIFVLWVNGSNDLCEELKALVKATLKVTEADYFLGAAYIAVIILILTLTVRFCSEEKYGPEGGLIHMLHQLRKWMER